MDFGFGPAPEGDGDFDESFFLPTLRRNLWSFAMHCLPTGEVLAFQVQFGSAGKDSPRTSSDYSSLQNKCPGFFSLYRVNFPGAHRAFILRNSCSQSEIFHHCQNAPTAPRSWLSALPAASAPIHGVAGRESRLRSRWEISDWLLELRNIIARCAPGKFTLQKKGTGHLFCNER